MSNTNEIKELLAEERQVLAEEQKVLKQMKRTSLLIILGAAAIVGLFAAVFFMRMLGSEVSVTKAQITAPTIDLAPQNAGTLQETYVQEGDVVAANAPVARVGNEILKATQGGLVIAVKHDIGKLFNRGEAVVTMIDPNALRVVARVEEDKGLKDLRIGQIATFTVDAFGAKKFVGTVDEISPTSRQSGIVFNISDKREIQEFEVKIRFDVEAYPELKNGMSAKVTIYKN